MDIGLENKKKRCYDVILPRQEGSTHAPPGKCKE